MLAGLGTAHAQERFYPAKVGTCTTKIGYGIIKVAAVQCRAIGGAMNGTPADTAVVDCHLDWCKEDGVDHYVVAATNACGVPAATGLVQMPASHCSMMGGGIASAPSSAGLVECSVALCGYGTTSGYAAARLGTCATTGVSGYIMALARDCRAMGGAMEGNPPDDGWARCQLELCPRSLDQVCLRTASGHYVSASGSGVMTADTPVCGTNETFDIVGLRGELAQGQLALLRSRDGTFVRATSAGQLLGRSQSLGDPELFVVQKSRTSPLVLGEATCLRNYWGKLVTAVGGGGGAMAANATACVGPEFFTPVEAFPNISRGKYAQQSSDYVHSCSPTASKAIDGNRDGNFGACSTTATNEDQAAWWQVDLLGTYDLKRMAIYNRADCCSDRLRDFEVKTSLDGVHWVTGASSPSAVGVLWQADIGGHARYVRVQLRGKNHLSLTEVEVYGLQVPNTPTFPPPRPSPPVEATRYVTGLKFVFGDAPGVACPAGMTRVETDLNEGAGGKYIYACLQYGPVASAIGGFSVLTIPECDYACATRYKDDLNRGAGGSYIFIEAFAYKPSDPRSRPLKDVAFTVWRTIPLNQSDICAWDNGWERALTHGSSTYGGGTVQTAMGDLNYGAGGRFIYACVQY